LPYCLQTKAIIAAAPDKIAPTMEIFNFSPPDFVDVAVGAKRLVLLGTLGPELDVTVVTGTPFDMDMVDMLVIVTELVDELVELVLAEIQVVTLLPPTRVPIPQGMALPSGCLAFAGATVVPVGD